MTLADLDEVLEIEHEAFATEHARRLLLEELDREFASIDVIRRGAGADEILGYCNYWLVRDEVHLLNVATRASAKRQGVARALIDHLIEFAGQNKCRYITLEVRRSNVAAIALYRDTGFAAVGVRPKYYPEDNEDALVMLRHL